MKLCRLFAIWRGLNITYTGRLRAMASLEPSFGMFVWSLRLKPSFEVFVCSPCLESSLELSRHFLRVRISPTMLTFNVWAIDAVPRMISPDVGDKKRHLLKLCAYSKGVQEELK